MVHRGGWRADYCRSRRYSERLPRPQGPGAERLRPLRRAGPAPLRHCRAAVGAHWQRHGGERHQYALPHHGTHLVLRTLRMGILVHGEGRRRGTDADVQKRHRALRQLKLYTITSLDGDIATTDAAWSSWTLASTMKKITAIIVITAWWTRCWWVAGKSYPSYLPKT